MTYLLLDTSTPVCRISFVRDETQHDYSWQADRTLAKNILTYIDEVLTEENESIATVSGLGVFRGPGSFTGLRIGLTVMNTVATSEDIPIVGEIGDDWIVRALSRLTEGDNDKIVLPEYGSDARITKPRK